MKRHVCNVGIYANIAGAGSHPVLPSSDHYPSCPWHKMAWHCLIPEAAMRCGCTCRCKRWRGLPRPWQVRQHGGSGASALTQNCSRTSNLLKESKRAFRLRSRLMQQHWLPLPFFLSAASAARVPGRRLQGSCGAQPPRRRGGVRGSVHIDGHVPQIRHPERRFAVRTPGLSGCIHEVRTPGEVKSCGGHWRGSAHKLASLHCRS